MAKKYKIERNLVLNQLKEGGAEDSVLVIDGSNEVGAVPRSEFGGGGSQDLQSVLDNGRSAVFDNGNQFIRAFDLNTDAFSFEIGSSDGAQKSTTLLVGVNGVVLSHSQEGSQQTLDMQDGNFYLQKSSTDGIIILSFENPLYGSGQVNIKIPSKSIGGEYTLATLDDIPTGLTATIAIVGGGEMVFTNGILTDIIPALPGGGDDI